MTSLFVFILSSKNWMSFPEKKSIIFSSKYFDLDCIIISSARDDCEEGTPQRCSRPGSSLQQPEPRFQTKPTS